MAIDAVIERILPLTTREGLRLILAPRVDSEGKDTCAGRPALHIVGERTVLPAVGMEIWGGAGWVEIVGLASYDRKGSFLRERLPCPRCDRFMRWVEAMDEETGMMREFYFCNSCGRELPISGGAS